MAYQDIDRWQQMSKDELYQELVKLHGDDTPTIDEIVYIYVNNCYELAGQLCEGYPDCFRVLYPKVKWEGVGNQVKTGPEDALVYVRYGSAPDFESAYTKLARERIVDDTIG